MREAQLPELWARGAGSLSARGETSPKFGFQGEPVEAESSPRMGPGGREGTRSSFLGPSGSHPVPHPGLEGARRLGTGFVGILAIEQESRLGVALQTSKRTKFGSVAAFLSV